MRLTPLLLVASFLATQMAVADPQFSPPEKAIAITSPASGVVLVWIPPTEEIPSKYKVYGIGSSGAVPLLTTPLLFATVPSGYSAYAVAALYEDGGESPPQDADPCIGLDTNIPPNPPYVSLENCL